MGVSYRAYVIVGVPLVVSDFVEVRDVKKVLCDHPEADAPGTRFCPSCGCSTKKRVLMMKREFPRPEVASMTPFDEMNVEQGEPTGWAQATMRERHCVGSLRTFSLSDIEDETPQMVLGKQVVRFGEAGSTSYEAVALEQVSQATREVQEVLSQVGIAASPVMYCLLRCS